MLFRRNGQPNNTSDTEANVLDLHLREPFSNDFVSSKIYDKRDDFDFDIIVFPLFGR